MPKRAVLARELRSMEVGELLLVPFKFVTADKIRVALHTVRGEGLDFDADTSGYDFASIRRIK